MAPKGEISCYSDMRYAGVLPVVDVWYRISDGTEGCPLRDESGARCYLGLGSAIRRATEMLRFFLL